MDKNINCSLFCSVSKVNENRTKIMGLIIANGLVALAGSIFAQSKSY